MKLKNVATQAVYDLAVDVSQGVNRWPQIDRIERRWNIQGAADHFLKHWTTEQAEYTQNWIEQHTTWEDRLWLR